MQVKVFIATRASELEELMNIWLTQVNGKVLGINYHVFQRTDIESSLTYSALVNFEETKDTKVYGKIIGESTSVP